MPSTRQSIGRPAVLASLGVLAIVSALVTFRGACAPVGGYAGPSGFRHLVVDLDALGVAYGNDCVATVSPVPVAVGLALLVVAVFRSRRP